MKKYLILLTVILNLTNCLISFAFPPDNQWSALVTQQCRTDTVTCRANITQVGNNQQLLACIQCCGGATIIGAQTCNSYCICECAIGAAPNGPNTIKLCSIPTPPQPAPPPQLQPPLSTPTSLPTPTPAPLIPPQIPLPQ